jgi:hypothetical protein
LPQLRPLRLADLPQLSAGAPIWRCWS